MNGEKPKDRLNRFLDQNAKAIVQGYAGEKLYTLGEMADLMEKIQEYVGEKVVVKRKIVDKEWKNYVEILTDQYEYQGLGWEIDWPRLFRERPDLVEKKRKGEKKL